MCAVPLQHLTRPTLWVARKLFYAINWISIFLFYFSRLSISILYSYTISALFMSLQLYNAESKYVQTPDGLVASRISIAVPLQSAHFHGTPPATTNGLTLKCIAEIPNLYLEHTDLELGVPHRDPIPARGKYPCNEHSSFSSQQFHIAIKLDRGTNRQNWTLYSV